MASGASASMSLSTARLMLPDDANPAGNVHGGTILRMIEEAGYVVATRLCNQPSESTGAPPPPVLASFAQIHQMDFLLPMYVGELAKLYATPTFTSDHSVEVAVDVWAENVVTGEVRQTNRAIVFFVAVARDSGRPIDFAIRPLVPATPAEQEQFALGLERYHHRKRTAGSPLSTSAPSTPTIGFAFPSATAQAVNLVQVMLPGDCHFGKVVGGGVILKLMDNAAGVCAAKHCRSNIVTVSIDTLAFTANVRLGDVVHVRAAPLYTSARAMDILVAVEAERVFDRGTGTDRILTTRGVFTFVSLDANHRPQPLPPITPSTPEETELFEQRRAVHEERKRRRAAHEAKK